jgi:multidrug transporter EmrE-like cation transporter
MDIGFLSIIALSAVEVYGDFALRFYAQTNKITWLAHGLVGYAGVICLLIMSFKYNNVLYVNGMWDGVSGIIESLAAYYILGDRFEKTSQYLGLGMIVVGVALMKDGFPTFF